MIAAGLCLLSAMLTSNNARAVLINLIPGGWDVTEHGGFPPEVSLVLDANFFDEVRNIPFDEPDGTVHPPGWVNLFGSVHGQDFIQTDVLSNPGPVAHVQWDFSSRVSHLAFLYVQGGDVIDIYEVNPEHRKSGKSDGFVPVTVDGHTPVQLIGFYGRSSVPDSGTTLGLMSVALAGLAFAKWRGMGGKAKNEPIIIGALHLRQLQLGRLPDYC